MPYGQINWTGPSPVGGNPGNSGGLLLSRLFGMGGGGGQQAGGGSPYGEMAMARMLGLRGAGGGYDLPPQQVGAPGGWGGGGNWGGGGQQPRSMGNAGMIGGMPWSAGAANPMMNFGFGGGIGFGQPLPMSNGGGFANPVTLPQRPDLSQVQPLPQPAPAPAPQPRGPQPGRPGPGAPGRPQPRQAAPLAPYVEDEAGTPFSRLLDRRRYLAAGGKL